MLFLMFPIVFSSLRSPLPLFFLSSLVAFPSLFCSLPPLCLASFSSFIFPFSFCPCSPLLFFFLLSVVQCWSGSDGEWQWLLDEEDDELKMALAVLVRLSSFCPPFSFVSLSRFSFLSSLYSPFVSFFFSSRCLVAPLPFLHCLSLAFISQGKPCGGNGCLVIWRQRDCSHKMCP